MAGFEDLIAQIQGRHPMDERLPSGQSPADLMVNPNWRTGSPTFAQAPSGPNLSELPTAVTPGIVGGAPPQLATPPPSMRSPVPTGAGGGMIDIPPQMRGAGMPPVSGVPEGPQGPGKYPIDKGGLHQFEFMTKNGRNAAVAQGAIQGMAQFGQNLQQKKFDNESAAARDTMMKYIQMKQQAAALIAKQDPESQQAGKQMDAEAEKMKQDKGFVKAMKNVNKPGSAAYLGVQQAYGQVMKQNQQQMVLDMSLAQMRSQMEQSRAQAQKTQAEAAAMGWVPDPKEPGGGHIDPAKMFPHPDTKYIQEETTKRAQEANASRERVAMVMTGNRQLNAKPRYVQDTKSGQWYEEYMFMNGKGQTTRQLNPLPKNFVPAEGLQTYKEELKTDEFGTTEQKTTIIGKGQPRAGFAIPDSSNLNPYKDKKISSEQAVSSGALNKIDYWAYHLAAYGKLPPAVSTPALKKALSRRMPELGLDITTEPSAQAKSRAQIAEPLLGYAGGQKVPQGGLIDKTERDIRIAVGAAKNDPQAQAQLKKMAQISKELGQELGDQSDYQSFLQRWKARFTQELGTISPTIQTVQDDLTSIYSIAGGMHSWRAIQVATEFEKKFGGLTTRPDSIIAGLESLRETANLMAMVGDPAYKQAKMKENPGAFGQGGAATPATPAKPAEPAKPKVITYEDFMNKTYK